MPVWLYFSSFLFCSVLFLNTELYILYRTWYVYKPLFGSSVATCRLACSEISLSIIGKKLKRSPVKGQTYYNLANGVTALAKLYALYSHRARSFNQRQRALYPNFIIMIDKSKSWKRPPRT